MQAAAGQALAPNRQIHQQTAKSTLKNIFLEEIILDFLLYYIFKNSSNHSSKDTFVTKSNIYFLSDQKVAFDFFLWGGGVGMEVN